MRVIYAFLVIFITLAPSEADASWFEACQLEGKVGKLIQDDEKARFVIHVANAKSIDERSYVDCKDYIGRAIPVSSSNSEKLRNGEIIKLNRIMVDVIVDNGNFQTVINVELK